MAISSLGMSGLPLADLLQNLRTNESLVLNNIKSRQTAAESKLSAYSKLKDSLTAFQKAADAVGSKGDAFGTLSVKPGSEAFSATATSSAIAGQYSVQVDQLASAQTLVYAGQGSRTDDIGTGGTLKITIDGTEHSLDLSEGTSLNKLVAAINADQDIGVNATIVNDGNPGSQYRLLLTSRETGAQNAVTNISVDGNAELNSFLGYAGGDSTATVQVQAATDAKLTINGIEVTSATNTIKNVSDGVELTLNQTTDSAESLNLTRDDSVAKKAITDFVSAYNSLLGTIKAQTAFNTDAQTSSPLTGDSLTRSVQTRMRDALSGVIDTESGTTLSSIGITTDPKTGELSINDSKLTEALSENIEGVKSLFTGTSGVGTRVSETADSFLRFDGLFSTTTDSLNKTISDIKKQYDATADRIDQRMETYRAQFTQLDGMVSQMNSLSSYLAQQLSALNAAK